MLALSRPHCLPHRRPWLVPCLLLHLALLAAATPPPPLDGPTTANSSPPVPDASWWARLEEVLLRGPAAMLFMPVVSFLVTSAPLLAITGATTVLWRWLDQAVYTRATVYSEVEAFQWVNAWLARQPEVVEGATQVEVEMDTKAGGGGGHRRYSHGAPAARTRHGVRFRPAKGLVQRVAFCDSQGAEHELLIERKSERVESSSSSSKKAPERQYFEIIVRNPRVNVLPAWLTGSDAAGHAKATLKDLLDQAKTVYYEQELDRTPMYYYDWTWERWCSRRKRSLESVHLAPALLDDLVSDVRWWTTSADTFYKNLGIPYRRGYLLHGVPGSGKSSVILAIAGHFDMPICVVDLSEFNGDGSFYQAMNSAPVPSILVFEEVDTAFRPLKSGGSGPSPKGGDGDDDDGSNGGADSDDGTGGPNSDSGDEEADGEGDGEGEGEGKGKGPGAKPIYRKPAFKVSFNGFLNALDGVVAQEGRLVFFTTNHRERLDPALTRPGRVDREFCFTWATPAQIAGMFVRFFEGDGAYTNNHAALQKDAQEFGELLAPANIAMARVQGYLCSFMRKENAARAALDNAPAHFGLAPSGLAAGGSSKDQPKSISDVLFSLPTVNSCEEDERVFQSADWLGARGPEALRRAISLPAQQP